MSKNKDKNQGGLELLVNCITEGSPLQKTMQNDENSCISKNHYDQCIQTRNLVKIIDLKVLLGI